MHRVQQIVRRTALLAPSLVGLLALALRQWKGSHPWELALVASAPYLMLLAILGPVAALVLRAWWMALASALVTFACIYTQAPLYVADTEPVTAARFVVMTQNTDLGRARDDDIVRAVRAHHVDALVLTELTPLLRERLQRAGLDKQLPFNVVWPMPGADGTGIWSRTRLSGAGFVGGFTCRYVTARADVDWGRGPMPIQLVGLHLIGPTWDAAGWRRDAERLPGQLRREMSSRPTIVAGDFNATPDSPWLRAALGAGLTNAADAAGAGLVRTYPADFPLLAIDHVLTSRLVAQSVVRVRVAGTDHRGVVATVAAPVSRSPRS